MRAMAALAATAACVFALAGPAQADLDPREDSYNGLRASGTPSGYTYIPTLRPIYRVKTKDPVFFITIDDGIYKDLAARRLVEKRPIPVTSFLTAWTVKDRSRYFERVSSGGSIQNHSATHASFSLLSTDLNHELCYTQQKLRRDFGRTPWMLRPPYGEAADSPRVRAVARRCGIERIVMWDTVIEGGRVSYRDGRLRPGSIVLLHFGPDLERDLRTALRVARSAGLQPADLAAYLPKMT